MCTGRGSNQGSLGPKSDALTTAPLRSLYVYCACVISQSSNDGLHSKENLIRPTKVNMATKFVENFIFLRGIGEGNEVQNLILSFIYKIIKYVVLIIPYV